MFWTLLIKNFCRIKSKPRLIMKNQKGVTAVIVAIVAAVLIAFAALAIDVGYMYATRNELQNVADAAALAGCGELGRIYLKITEVHGAAAQQSYDVNSPPDGISGRSAINAAVINVALKNKAANTSITIKPADIHISIWDWENSILKMPEEKPPLAVQVTARRDETINGAVATFFARILSIFGGSHDTFEASAVATAALSSPSKVDEGVLNVPFGIADTWFDQDCTDVITFKSNDDCAGWHNYLDSPNDPDTSDMGEKCLNFIKYYPDGTEGVGYSWLMEHFGDWNKIDQVGSEISDETSTDISFYFTEGVGSLIPKPDAANYIYWTEDKQTITGYSAPGKKPAPMAALFDFFRFRDDDGDNAIWTTTVPVYKGCTPANQYKKIIGFANIIISGVNPPPESTIDVRIDCEQKIISGRSGGAQYGSVMGNIPNLVQ